MKKVITILAVAVMVTSQAKADTFLDDYNSYAKYIYGIPAIETVIENVSYRSDSVEITKENEVIVTGNDPLDVISAACCALRAIDANGSLVDQYGRVMHAYFLNRVREKETRATTESGILVYVSESEGTYTIRLVTR